MSVRGFREVYRCPQCRAEVTQGDAKCKNGHTLEWIEAAAVRVAPSAGGASTKPTTFLETKIEWGVFGLYVIIVGVLGISLLYSLSKGTDYTTFASAIVTALTTIAGFAVGVNAGNSGTPSSSTHK